MKSWIVVLLAASCQGGPVQGGAANGSSPLPSPGVATVPGAPTRPAAPPYLIEAPPGGKIVRLAATPAADAALTVDDANEVRLWPTLDGTRAPVVVELPPATTLALQRFGSDYVAVMGLIGGALLVQIDANGKRRSVIEFPAIDGVAAIDAGFVTWSGKHLEWIDLAGKVTRTSDTEPRPVLPPPRVTANDSDLVIAERYLGYAFPYAGPPRGRDPHHLIVAGPANRFLVVTADLTVVGELSPWTPNGESATAMTWVGDKDWLVDVPSGVVVWTEGAATGTLVPKVAVAEVDLESHLVLLSGPRKSGEVGMQLARYMLPTHALDPIAFAGWGTATTTGDVHLIPPSKNRGALLVITQFDRDTQGVAHGHARWVHDVGA